MISPTRSNLNFWLGFTVLTVSAITLQVAKEKQWLYIIKKPLPITRPLSEIDRRIFSPFEVAEMAPLSAEIIQELGTTEYVNLILKQPGRKTGVDREAMVSITYYTDVQDQVPHVPEECYSQGGNFTPAGDVKMSFTLDGLGETVAIRRLSFFAPGELVKRNYVYYTICVNGHFCSDRNTVRAHMSDPRDKYLYYSKVEIAFDNAMEKDVPLLDEKAQALFDQVLTELMKSHWPPRGSEHSGIAPANKTSAS